MQPNHITQSQQENLRRGTYSGHPQENMWKHYCPTGSRVFLDTLMKSSSKAKSFHVAVQGSSPQHVTLPSRILIWLSADEWLAT
jgi:hypothetical protein